MGRQARQELIKRLEKDRDGRLLIAYVTSTRTGFEISIADDILPLLREHLEKAPDKAKHGVDLFIHSNGGSGTVPWRVVNLIREYTDKFAVLVPHRAFSAATLIALGADEIIMHRMGCLGPIDPSVANVFNPPHPYNPALPAPISVEDVSAYFKLVKEEVGISHEDELVQALIALTEKIHPLALGNVQRSHNQSRMLAQKLLRKHMSVESQHEIETIIDTLKSNLFFHGHPINRKEARDDLKLKVVDPSPVAEQVMWELYAEYEGALKLKEPFTPIHEIDVAQRGAPTPPTVQELVQKIRELSAAGVQLVPGGEEQVVRLAAAMVNVLGRVAPKTRLEKLPGAYLESVDHTDVFLTDMAIERATINTPAGPQDAVKQEVLWQRWELET